LKLGNFEPLFTLKRQEKEEKVGEMAKEAFLIPLAD